MMGWFGGGAIGSLGLLGMGAFWLVLLGVIIWAVVRLLPGSDTGVARDDSESALDMLDRRLASGQIDMQEWQSQRSALEGAQRIRT